MAELRTSAPRRERGTDTRVIVNVDGQEPLWFSVAHEHAALLSDRADHVALAMLMPAMKAGRDLHIGGVMTDVLLHQINTDLQPLLQAIHPEFTMIRVDAEELAPPAHPDRAWGPASRAESTRWPLCAPTSSMGPCPRRCA